MHVYTKKHLTNKTEGLILQAQQTRRGIKMTDVMDLSTGTVYSYDAKPKEALIMCFEQISKGNYNTWSYNFNQPIIETDICYSLGDLAVYKDGRDIK